MPNSYDSGTRPLTNVQYQSANNPYSQGYDNYNQSAGYLPSKKKGMSKWIKIGVPVLILVIAGAVVGGILGSRSNKSGGGGNGSSPASASSAVANKDAVGVFATATDVYGQPQYPTATNAAFIAPTFVASAQSKWPEDPFKPATPQPTNVREDRPRLIAPKYKWDALPSLVAGDPYMRKWNETIVRNATQYMSLPLVPYRMDGESGVLDVARELKMRMKAYAYSFRVTGNNQFAERAWDELQNAAANTSQPFGTAPDNWNSGHFLDVAEFTAAFAIGYDWLYDHWTVERRTAIMWTILNLGLDWGMQAYNGASFAWWREPANGNGNWNCVCNSGLTMGALAILGDDPTGTATRILANSIPNARENCARGPTSDGSSAETADYWYFGTTAHAELSASLLSATGGDHGMLPPTFNRTGLFHLYITGMTQMFQFGDHGPNKFSTTANSMTFYGSYYNAPAYMLFQRDRPDAWSDPWSIFYYNPTVAGAFWNGLPLDHFFNDPLTQWGSMRSSWTDTDGTFLAIKAGNNSGHQNHQDLDVGTFVFDAMGERWAGELGSGDYLSTGYFNGNQASDPRWLYYRKRTEGQNTIVVGRQNQNILTAPRINSGSSGEAQDGNPNYQVPATSSAYFTLDGTSAYGTFNSWKRGARFINGRKQILLQDEIDATAEIEWRMHTNATIEHPADNRAVLTLNGKKLEALIVSPASGARFQTLPASRYDTDPALPTGQSDQPNPGVSVLAIQLPAGQHNLQVVFNPQWSGGVQLVTPKNVAIDGWSVASHN